ncbi:hypothetical protein C8R34_10413 [Nitrosomonas sp. Nm84]|nr:hypothetical protein C8R34_10413 [Nitrosomonas sp. Nm84]
MKKIFPKKKLNADLSFHGLRKLAVLFTSVKHRQYRDESLTIQSKKVESYRGAVTQLLVWFGLLDYVDIYRSTGCIPGSVSRHSLDGVSTDSDIFTNIPIGTHGTARAGSL